MKIQRIIFFAIVPALLILYTPNVSAQTELASVELPAGLVFTDAESNSLEVAPGTYFLEEADDGLRFMSATEDRSFVVAATQGTHEETLEEPVGIYDVADDNVHHVVLLLPDGETFEVRATPGGIVTRGVPMRIARPRLTTATATKVQATSPTYQSTKPAVTAQISKNLVAQIDANTLSSYEFGKVVSAVFSGASFSANACGGSYTYRNTIINIPNILYKKEGLSRLHYALTDGEKEKAQFFKEEESFASDSIYRKSKIRMCVDNWNVRSWSGGIERGAMKIRLRFGSLAVIRGRAIDIQWTGAWWNERWSWSSNSADDAFPNYHLQNPVLEVTLVPQLDGQKRISYGNVSVLWKHQSAWVYGNHSFDDYRHTDGSFVIDALRRKSEDYKNASLETLRLRTVNLFQNSAIRNVLAQATSDFVTSHPLVTRVVAITPADSKIRLQTE